MKTFSNFIVEAKNYGPEPGSSATSETGSWKTMSDADFEKYVKKLGPGGEALRRKRAKFKQTYNQAQQPRANQSQPKPPQQPSTTPASKPQATPSTTPASKPQATPSSWKSKAGTGLRRGFGAWSALDAATAAGEGRYGDAFTSGLLAAQGSRRLTRGVPQAGRTAVQNIATRLGKPALGKAAARFVPGLGTAYGLARGTQAAMRGDQLGAALGYGSALPVVGGAFAAADIARDVMPQSWKNKIAQTVGYRRTDTAAAQTKQDIEKLKNRPRTSPAQMLSTMDARSARQKAAQAGVSGARSGSAVVGAGGKTSVDTKKNTITTGGKTAQLPKTMLLPGGKVGDLAYKGGKPVYLARASVASRDTNVLSRLSRATGIGGQRERDAAAAKQEYRTALASTQKYYKDIGVKDPAKVTLKPTGNLPARPLPGYGGAPKPAAKPTPKPAAKPTPKPAAAPAPAGTAWSQRLKARRGR